MLDMMPPRRPNSSSANAPAKGTPAPSVPAVGGSLRARSNTAAQALIHFEGEWPFRERLWLRQRVREADRTLERLLVGTGEQPFLFNARWLAQRSPLDGGGVRLTVHRQGTGQVLVGASLEEIDGQISRLPLIELERHSR